MISHRAATCAKWCSKGCSPANERRTRFSETRADPGQELPALDPPPRLLSVPTFTVSSASRQSWRRRHERLGLGNGTALRTNASRRNSHDRTARVRTKAWNQSHGERSTTAGAIRLRQDNEMTLRRTAWDTAQWSFSSWRVHSTASRVRHPFCEISRLFLSFAGGRWAATARNGSQVAQRRRFTCNVDQSGKCVTDFRFFPEFVLSLS